MPVGISDISFHKSLNTVSGTESLGGAIGTELSPQYAQAQPAVVTGCYISRAQGNSSGTGELVYNPTQQTLSWRPPQSAVSFMSPPITANGSFTFGTLSTGTVTITYTYAQLPTTYKTENIVIVTPVHTVFDKVTTSMALLGDTQYRCLYIRNNHATLTATEVRAYLYAMPVAPQVVEIGKDPAGLGDGTTTGVAQTIADKSTAPSGVVFSSPTTAAAGISLGAIAPNTCIAVWQKRVVPNMSYGSFRVVDVAVGITFLG